MKRLLRRTAGAVNDISGGRLSGIDHLSTLYKRVVAGHHEFDQFEAYVPPARVGIWNESDEESFIRSHAAGSTFWEIGANIGYFALSAAPTAAFVRAFEPEPINYSYLERNCTLNEFANLEPHQIAVADEDGTTGLYRAEQAGAGIHSLADGDRRDAEPCTFETRKFDTLVSQYGTPHFVKVDVEGAELKVLRGAERSLQTGDVDWFIEVHSPRTGDRIDRLGQHGGDVETLYDLLVNSGYEIRGYRSPFL